MAIAVGLLEEKTSGARIVLGSRSLIGRHASCDLRPQDPRVSSEHALLRFVDGRWELRDLGSRNGTFFEGRRLTPGERVPLFAGALFELGGARSAYRLVETGAPQPSAKHLGNGQRLVATDRVLVLPDDEQPQVTVFEGPGGWTAEGDDMSRDVVDGEVLEIGGVRFELDLPSGADATLDTVGGPLLESIGLHFSVSRDEEHVEVTVLHDGGTIALPPRTYHYVLLVLARERLRDVELPPSDRGWVDREELCRMLAVDSLKLNVDICRIRKQLASIGVLGAAGIVARSATSGQFQLAAQRIEGLA